MTLINALKHRATLIEGADYFTSKLNRFMVEKDVILVGLCGESAAGKSTLLQHLQKSLPIVSVVNADNYFCDISDKIKQYGSFTKLLETGYDSESPDNFQLNALAQDLLSLKRSRTIQTPAYEMRTGASIPDQITCQPTKITIVESICTFYEPVRDLFDLKIYLTVDPAVQWERYVKRAAERGQNPAEMKRQFNIVSAAAKKYLHPNKQYADLIIQSKQLPIRIKKHTKPYRQENLHDRNRT